MMGSEPLYGETVIFTGTPKSTAAFNLVKSYGGTVKSLPLIEVAELAEDTDKLRLEACDMYDWLIFTSQSAVASFAAKLARHEIDVSTIQTNIAAIGTRTAAALEKIGLTVQFIPSVFSADVFVQEFKPVENDLRRLLFLRGTIAGSTIKDELPFEVDEWTVYETERVLNNIDEIVKVIQSSQQVSILFASPSAVAVFKEDVVPRVGWEGYTIGAIGHITEKALVEAGAQVDVCPATYTLVDLVEKLANRKDVQ